MVVAEGPDPSSSRQMWGGGLGSWTAEEAVLLWAWQGLISLRMAVRRWWEPLGRVEVGRSAPAYYQAGQYTTLHPTGVHLSIPCDPLQVSVLLLVPQRLRTYSLLSAGSYSPLWALPRKEIILVSRRIF